MAIALEVPTMPVDDCDTWVDAAEPDVELAVDAIRRLRALVADARVAEAHILGYLREKAGSDLLDDDAVLEALAIDF
jgi:hypothetical protein